MEEEAGATAGGAGGAPLVGADAEGAARSWPAGGAAEEEVVGGELLEFCVWFWFWLVLEYVNTGLILSLTSLDRRSLEDRAAGQKRGHTEDPLTRSEPGPELVQLPSSSAWSSSDDEWISSSVKHQQYDIISCFHPEEQLEPQRRRDFLTDMLFKLFIIHGRILYFSVSFAVILFTCVLNKC